MHRRRRLFGIQGGICHYCKNETLFKHWTVDHIVPVSKGGSNLLENTVGACSACNGKKGDISYHRFIAKKYKPTPEEQRASPGQPFTTYRHPNSGAKRPKHDWIGNMREQAYPSWRLAMQGLNYIRKHRVSVSEFRSIALEKEWKPDILRKLIRHVCDKLK